MAEESTKDNREKSDEVTSDETIAKQQVKQETLALKSENKSEQRQAIMQTSKKRLKKDTPEDVYHTIKFMEGVPLNLQAEVARTELPLRQILSWKPGSIVQFDKIIGEPMEVLIGEQLIARGEVVVINDRYGIRISEITKPDEKVS